jgi:hypothetical protein
VRKGRGPAAAARHRRLGRESAGRGATSALLNLRRSHHVRELVVVVVVDPVFFWGGAFTPKNEGEEGEAESPKKSPAEARLNKSPGAARPPVTMPSLLRIQR